MARMVEIDTGQVLGPMGEIEIDARFITLDTVIDLCPQWFKDTPPIDATGDPAKDMVLADAYRMMIYLDDPHHRMAWLEKKIRRRRDAPSVLDVFRRWWLDLNEAGQ